MIDVDLVQIHFASYFRWMDLAYSRLLADLGHPLPAILADGRGTPVVDAQCTYLSPVGLGDVVDVCSRVERHGRSSYIVRHDFEHAGRAVATGQVTHVWAVLDGSGAMSEPVPDWIAAAAHSTGAGVRA
ncbi:acyl-CoA thioesterase [Nocardioides massiliensis]|uniref:YbgC/YbaW family acyl-CoA thioester hydrolase n=1 Tax=Nocardioides massiliensis TaxID=1325935 RepID=A0ABT9NTD1_9ACTN|nr:acyl-CoA thioesterase [Nocardioides massiliensis]MDP9823671.1 YbgC/YbaW family acyl-CoA thioester hydrolase [Nocardioides massiliensis]